MVSTAAYANIMILHAHTQSQPWAKHVPMATRQNPIPNERPTSGTKSQPKHGCTYHADSTNPRMHKSHIQHPHTSIHPPAAGTPTSEASQRPRGKTPGRSQASPARVPGLHCPARARAGIVGLPGSALLYSWSGIESYRLSGMPMRWAGSRP